MNWEARLNLVQVSELLSTFTDSLINVILKRKLIIQPCAKVLIFHDFLNTSIHQGVDVHSLKINIEDSGKQHEFTLLWI